MSGLEAYRPATGLTDGVLNTHLVKTAMLSSEPRDIAVAMGSGSDLPAIYPALSLFKRSGIPYQPRIVSAHRTHEWLGAFGHSAAQLDIDLIIAIAGGSAHLPGDLASVSQLPVIGVAREDVPDMQNAALGSMLVMPPEGGPLVVAGKVTRVNNSGAINAAIFATKILGSRAENPGDKDAVAVIVDTDEGLERVEPAIGILDAFQIPYDVRVQSEYGSDSDRHAASEIREYVHHAPREGIGAVITMPSSYRSVFRLKEIAEGADVPIIGIADEVLSKDVLSSMLTELEEGTGVPVSGRITEQSNAGAVNAGLFAARVLAIGNPKLRSYIEQRMQAKALAVLEDDRLLVEVGEDEFMRIQESRQKR